MVFGTAFLLSDTPIGLKEVCLGGTQPSIEIATNLPSVQNFCVTKTRFVNRLQDTSHLRKESIKK